MWSRPRKSIIVIAFFGLCNVAVWWGAWHHHGVQGWGKSSDTALEKTPSTMEDLEYFLLDAGWPTLSMAAESMRAVGDERAEFVKPRGLYAVGEERTSLFYRGHEARYLKDKQQLTLEGEAALDYKQARYRADKIVYLMSKDLMWGIGSVSLEDTFAKTGDKLLVTGSRMKAKPKGEWALLTGDVVGDVKPKQKFRPPLHFRAQSLEMLGPTSEVRLRDDVFFHRGGMKAQAKSGDIFLENANRQLRYFVLNDDVKLREDLVGPPPQVRRAWAERMEGFGQDKVVLSGAPRVEQGKDTVKGYRITLREQADFIEVEDAMSDLSTKKEDKGKE